jgi:hypothetical protein
MIVVKHILVEHERFIGEFEHNSRVIIFSYIDVMHAYDQVFVLGIWSDMVCHVWKNRFINLINITRKDVTA